MAIQLPYTGVTTNETIPAPYTNGGELVDLSQKEDKPNKGVANGYAPLDASAKVPAAYLPDTASLDAEVDGKITTHNSATTSVHGIANTANLVLTNDSRLADSRTPTAHTHTKSEITDFTHAHAVADVTGLQDALSGKQASGSYAPATGIAPSAITGTAVVTNDSRLNTATTSANGLMSSTDKSKLNGVASGAEVNVNADWNATSGDAQILNRPKVDTADLASVVGTSSNMTFGSVGGVSVLSRTYRPTSIGDYMQDIQYSTNGDPVFTIKYLINGTSTGGSTYNYPAFTGWALSNEDEVIAFSIDGYGRYDLPLGEFYTLPDGDGALAVTIDEGASAAGGKITTSGGGGEIDTRMGKIGLGYSGARTTLYTTATSDINIYLGDQSGTLALKSHTHGNITTDGRVGSSGAVLSISPVGNINPIPAGNYPILQSNNQSALVAVGPYGIAGAKAIVLLGSAYLGTGYSIGSATVSGVAINIDSVSGANLPLITSSSGVVTTGTFGTTANSFCQGNDSRLSNARTPSAHTHSISEVTSLQATLTAFAIALG